MSSTHQSAPPKLAHINPADDKTPGNTTDENLMMNTIEREATVFAKAINKLIRANTTSSKPKL